MKPLFHKKILKVYIMVKPVCGIILYGMKYIEDYPYMQEWKDMNKGVAFYICTMCVETEDKKQREEDFLRSLPDCIVMDNPLFTWVIERIKRDRLPIHILVDVIRWYALQEMMKLSNVAYVIEGDVKCLQPDWMTSCLPDVQQGITIFGRDRACIVSKDSPMDDIDPIIRMYENTYKYLLVPKVFTGNFLYTMLEDNVEAKLARQDYDEALELARGLPPDKVEEAEAEFIKLIPFSILAIGIRQLHEFKLHLPTRTEFDAERKNCYVHEQKLEWSKGGSRKRKKRKTHRKKYGIRKRWKNSTAREIK